MDQHPTSRYVPEGERIVLRLKPSAWSIVLSALWPLVGGTVVAIALLSSVPYGSWGWWGGAAFAAAVGVRLGWEVMAWAAREYVLTEGRVVSATGVLRRRVADVPIANIQNVVVHRLLRERFFGLGTIGFASSGTDTYEVGWLMVNGPDRVLDTIRLAMGEASDQSGQAGSLPHQDDRPEEGRPDRPVVIGLAGGIGSGKSTVARTFSELGCVVSDSDRLAREALDRADVRAELVSWWGDRVLNAEGRVDRSAVAEIVFADASQRERLERLVHPIVRASRAELIAMARAEGAPAVIVDAPLLFEAGLDADCDAVVFVDVPRAVRLERVAATRGWDDDELARRESAQWPIEDKRARADHVVDNSGDPGALESSVSEILSRIVDVGGSVGRSGPK